MGAPNEDACAVGRIHGGYWRMGLPLQALTVAVSVPLLLIVWPL